MSVRSYLAARPASSPVRARRAGTACLLLVALQPTLAGCYTTVPLQTTTAPGSTLVLDLNDRGRVALGDSIGPSAARIAGVLAERDERSYVLRVSSVQYLNGQSNRWSGEPLVVPADLIGQARERRFSRSRTYGLAVGMLATLVAVATSTDLPGRDIGARAPESPPGQDQ